jgi:hypothetical protein
VDVATGTVTLLADGTAHGNLPGVPADASVFEEPTSLEADWARGLLHVGDGAADPLLNDALGAVYAFDVRAGTLRVEAASSTIILPAGLSLSPDGRLLVADAGGEVDGSYYTPVVLSIDLTQPADDNAEIVSTGFNLGLASEDYGTLDGLVVDETGQAFLADSGFWEETPVGSGTWVALVDPRVLRLPPVPAGANLDALLVRDVPELVVPHDAAIVPPFRIDSVTPARVPATAPPGCGGVITILVYGVGLVPALDYDLGPNLTVVASRFVDGAARGTAIELDVIPSGGIGLFAVTATHPFGGTATLASAAEIVAVGPADDASLPPCSSLGDASCDGIVDGVDLAILGMHFGQVACRDIGFLNDADFTDDDRIDGDDLAILGTFFGTRP